MKYQPTADELQSSCYHHKQKNCDIKWFAVPAIEEGKQIFKNKVVCKTHKANICYAERKCFWQIGLHFGTMSEGYDFGDYDESLT